MCLTLQHFSFRLILNADDPNGGAFAFLLVALWSSYILAEQLCITLLLFIKTRINVAIIVSYIFCVSLALASGTVRSFKGLQPFLQDNTRATHTRYASSLLHSATFLIRKMNCTEIRETICPVPNDYVHDHLGTPDGLRTQNADMAASIGFAVGFIMFNMLLYLIPVPNCIRRKFKD